MSDVQPSLRTGIAAPVALLASSSPLLARADEEIIATTSFDTTGWGILVNPGAKAGIQVAKDSWLTLQYEAYLSVYQATKLGTLTLSPDSTSYAGFGLTLVMEYSPKKEGVFYYGVALFNTAANYPIFFNVEASGSSEAFNSQKIWYLGLLAGYES